MNNIDENIYDKVFYTSLKREKHKSQNSDEILEFQLEDMDFESLNKFRLGLKIQHNIEVNCICDTKKFIQTKLDWYNFCKEKNINSTAEYEKACEIYDCLPKEPAEFYKPFTNILNELNIIKRR